MASWTDVDFSKLKALASFEEGEQASAVEHVPTAPGAPMRVERPRRQSIHPKREVKQVAFPSQPPSIYSAPSVPVPSLPQFEAKPQSFNSELTQPGLPARQAPIRPAPRVPIQPQVFSPPLPIPSGRFTQADSELDDDCTIPLIHTPRPLATNKAQTWSPPSDDPSVEHTSIGFSGQRGLGHLDLQQAPEDKTDPRVNSPKPGWQGEFGATDPDFDDKTSF